MLSQEELEMIKEAIGEFFQMAGYAVDQEISSFEDSGQDNLDINIRTSDAQTLIGKQGLVLSDIQLILRKAIKKKTGREIFLNLDVDGYKKNKEGYLKGLARNIADEVAATGEQRELPSLSPFDRRVVHLELSERKDVVAESFGEGENRRLVIRPAK